MAENTPPTWLDLYDWRTRVAALYRERAQRIAVGDDPAAVWGAFRAAKDELFARHPQSPLDADTRASFHALDYFPYDPAFRVTATLTPEAPESADDEVLAPSSGPHAMPLRRAGRVSFTLSGVALSLAIYWIDVYGGGLFLPFRDTTSGSETYGAGRYLHDTVKGSDLLRLDDNTAHGYAGGRVLLDFNYAYNPSCAYDPRWVCPLTPAENRLMVAIHAGERVFQH
ncbi:MAG TPA: DUF1684 domain-containing protein [Ktedonobacterales bacterium]|nr:DUF1684 domain-containing protein [Ktedonobacterales bacterium]